MVTRFVRHKTVSKDWEMTPNRLDAMKTNWGIYCLKGMRQTVSAALPLSSISKNALYYAIDEAIRDLKRRNSERQTAGKKRSARKGR